MGLVYLDCTRGTVNARGLCTRTRTVYVGQITRGACVLGLYTWDS